MAANDIAVFGEKIAELDLQEVDLAVALLWFQDHEGEPEQAASDLARTIHDLALRGQVNISRLGTRLVKHPDVVRGRKSGTFKLKLSSKANLNSKYLPLLKRPKLKIEDHVLASEDFDGTKPYLEALVRQINGCYQDGFYDGCAVLCRRLTETLLISAFENAGEDQAIRKGKNYVLLAEIISTAKSGQHIKLSRTAPKDLDEIKNLGDTASHHRTYITKQPDINDIKLALRRIVAELMELAGIEPKKK